ncbi:hypothetical protein, partial [Klebsiella aerogenes]|uniref:hypothetical protein n=1 Tax=Klebsiella aerogenes TaxID=548 RepID=UPI001CC69DF4
LVFKIIDIDGRWLALLVFLRGGQEFIQGQAAHALFRSRIDGDGPVAMDWDFPSVRQNDL